MMSRGGLPYAGFLLCWLGILCAVSAAAAEIPGCAEKFRSSMGGFEDGQHPVCAIALSGNGCYCSRYPSIAQASSSALHDCQTQEPAGDCIVYSVDGRLTETASTLSEKLPRGEEKVAHGNVMDVGIRSCAQLTEDLGGLGQYMVQQPGRDHCIAASGYNSVDDAKVAVQAQCQRDGIACDEYAVGGQRVESRPAAEASANPSSGSSLVTETLNQAASVANDYRIQQQQIQEDQRAQRDAAARYRQEVGAQQIAAAAQQRQQVQSWQNARTQQSTTNQAKASTPQTVMPSSSRGSTSVASANRPQYHPSYKHQGVIEQDPGASIDGVPGTVSKYIVRVQNTGDVRLACRANAKARLAYANGGSCAGVSAQNCINGRVESVTSNQDVYAGGSTDIIVMRYYLGDGSYDVQCQASP